MIKKHEEVFLHTVHTHVLSTQPPSRRSYARLLVAFAACTIVLMHNPTPTYQIPVLTNVGPFVFVLAYTSMYATLTTRNHAAKLVNSSFFKPATLPSTIAAIKSGKLSMLLA
jgi:hypothetical protein